MTLIEDGKFQITLTAPEQLIKLPKSFNVYAYKFKWIQFNTIATGGTELTINVDELTRNGYNISNTNTYKTYSAVFPLDKSAEVTNLLLNFTDQYDARFRESKSINQLNFTILINGVLANDVSVSNPLVMELITYDSL